MPILKKSLPGSVGPHPEAAQAEMPASAGLGASTPFGADFSFNPASLLASPAAALPLGFAGQPMHAAPPSPSHQPAPPQPAPQHPPAPPKPAVQLEFRSIDGSGNNLAHGQENAVGSDFSRIGPANFTDHVGAMATNAPNARTISNEVVAGSGDVANAEGLSGMMYAWGQFVDHDLDLMKSDGKTHIDIAIPTGDPNLGATTISMTRTVIDSATGHDGKPAAAINNVTGWLDASQVYGSDAATAASLRSADGHMLTSAGNNLPIANGGFAAGDARVGENPDLTAVQTLFLREHNRQVDLLAKAHPDWSGDHLYQQARAIVTAEVEHVTYSEFLPHLLGKGAITPYHGYNANVDASLSEEFAGAAFRFGHSIVSANLQKISENGSDTGAALSLKDAFFQDPAGFAADGGAAGLLRHLSGDLSNALDVHIVDDLRNFLDVPPVAMDLAAINIQRGRDLGLGTLNQTREALHLKAYTDFNQITSDASTAAALKLAYGSVDKIDLWTGGLAENHVGGGMVGQTFNLIISHQFENLRDGDRLWYENQGFDQQALDSINHTTLSDLILLDTDTTHIQADAFVYYDRHSGLAGGIAAENPDAPQLVIGSDGGDTLAGGVKGDLLVAGSGTQLMTGGAGGDSFIFGKAGINATITDFRPGQDHIEFDGLGSGTPKLTAAGANTIVEFGGDHLLLLGISPGQLHGGDFVFL